MEQLTLQGHAHGIGSHQIGPYERAFLEGPKPPCSCLECNPKSGYRGLSCNLRALRNRARERDTGHSEPDQNDLDAFPDDEDLVQANLLRPDEKRTVWAYIQLHRPELANFLTNDITRDFVKAGATPVFPADVVRSALGYLPD